MSRRDQHDHLGHVAGGPRFTAGRQAAEHVIGPVEGPLFRSASAHHSTPSSADLEMILSSMSVTFRMKVTSMPLCSSQRSAGHS